MLGNACKVRSVDALVGRVIDVASGIDVRSAVAMVRDDLLAEAAPFDDVDSSHAVAPILSFLPPS